MDHIHTAVDEPSVSDIVSVLTVDTNTHRLKCCAGNRAKEVMFVSLANYYFASISPVDRAPLVFLLQRYKPAACELTRGTESRRWVFHPQRLCEYGPERLNNKHTQSLNGLF